MSRGGGEGALLDELLRRQARAHGLASWADTTPDQPDASTREELAEEAARLATFAGMRADVAGGAGGGASDESESESDGAPRPLSALAEAAADAAALEAHGLAVLKEELQRLGMKCGGTLQARPSRCVARVREERMACLLLTCCAALCARRSARRGCSR
jgi:hypothetical protein